MMIRLLAAVILTAAAFAAQPSFQSELIFPLESWHNHSSSIVELPDGELMVCWFHGSGERTADDVEIEAARLPRGATSWSPRFTLADTPGYPDTNPVLFVDSRARLWLIWPAILANRWETALLKYRISSDYRKPGLPGWDVSDNLLFIPPLDFQAKVQAFADSWMPKLKEPLIAEVKQAAAAAGDKLLTRIGWMPRTHPLELPSGRILVPLYSDGFSFGMVAITDDGGATWTASEPIVGAGSIQPSIVRKRDGSLVAYLRDNGPAPKRVMSSTSHDEGKTWTAAVDTDIPNPGSSVEVIALKDGTWLFVGNDLERDRYSLVAMLSDDEGATWKWRRHIESAKNGRYHYPSIIQARDGAIHLTYSYFIRSANREEKAIKHVRLNPEWVRAGH